MTNSIHTMTLNGLQGDLPSGHAPVTFHLLSARWLKLMTVSRLGKQRRSTSDQDQVAEAPRPGGGQ